jgi:hypothetical protein
MYRTTRAALLSILVPLATCTDDEATGLPHAAGIAYDASAGTAALAANGQPAVADGSILNHAFAIARPELDGVAILAFQPTGTGAGTLLVLQAPHRRGTYACAPHSTACMAHVLTGVPNVGTLAAGRQRPRTSPPDLQSPRSR